MEMYGNGISLLVKYYVFYLFLFFFKNHNHAYFKKEEAAIVWQVLTAATVYLFPYKAVWILSKPSPATLTTVIYRGQRSP